MRRIRQLRKGRCNIICDHAWQRMSYDLWRSFSSCVLNGTTTEGFLLRIDNSLSISQKSSGCYEVTGDQDGKYIETQFSG